MGQYYIIINRDKKQFVHPHRFGDGLKLLEFGCSATGTLTALAVLLASGNGRGGGDLRSENPIIGSWAGDRIVVAGDYGDEGLYVTPEDEAAWIAFKEKEAAEATDTQWSTAASKRERREDFKAKGKHPNLYDIADDLIDLYEDVSLPALLAICDDSYVREDIVKSLARYDFGLKDLVKNIKDPVVKKGVQKLVRDAKKQAKKDETARALKDQVDADNKAAIAPYLVGQPISDAAKITLYEKALAGIAVWGDKGPTTSLDEPCSARQAREVLRATGKGQA
jgi:hypothetical protein